MTERKRAGEPDVPRRTAGAPEASPAPAGAPSPEQPATEPAAEPESEAVEHDLDELLSTRKERDEYLELARRTKADFENYRRRAAGEAAEAERRGKAALARELVPVLDTLERALAAGVDSDGTEVEDGGAGLAHGVLLVYRDLHSTLERAGVETYDPTGERFDPNWHEALSTRASDGSEPGLVLETVEKGYRLDGQVLRPARVIVSE